MSFSVNVIPTFIIHLSDKSKLKFGLGGAYYSEGAFYPVFSTRFDTELNKDLLIGLELKSLVPYGTTPAPFPVLLLNYSFRI